MTQTPSLEEITSPSITRRKLPKDFVGSTGVDASAAAAPAELSGNSPLDEILLFDRKRQASDVHFSSNYPIIIRKFQTLEPITSEKLTNERIKNLLQTSFEQNLLSELMAHGGVEFVHTIKGGGRFRFTLMKTRTGVDMTARVIPLNISSFEESGIPASCKGLPRWAQGLVLIAGPAGSGKTSSLATLVELINQTRHDHIITIENPVEVVYTPKKCQITQREVGCHTLSQANALRAALRQDTDIIVISELRDLETFRLAVSAAETGHLVFGTMNTLTSGQTITSLIDSFPPEEQAIISVMISESLRGVICQQLIARRDGQGMVAAHEVLIVNTAVANLIREGRTQNIPNIIATGKSDGMVPFDNSLKDLLGKGLINGKEAVARAVNPKEFAQFANM